MNSKISEVYSDALFKLGVETDSLDSMKNDLVFVKQVLKENEDFKRILQNPNVKKEDKKEMLSKVFSGIDIHILNFAKILIDKSRFFYFDDIVESFIYKYNEVNSVAQGILTSVREMDPEDIETIKETLSKKFGKKVELDHVIDSNLIGGFSVMLDGKMIDNSLQGKLSSLKSSLREKR